MRIILSERYEHKEGGRRPICMERKYHMAFPEKEASRSISQLGGYTQPTKELLPQHYGRWLLREPYTTDRQLFHRLCEVPF